MEDFSRFHGTIIRYIRDLQILVWIAYLTLERIFYLRKDQRESPICLIFYQMAIATSDATYQRRLIWIFQNKTSSSQANIYLQELEK